MVGAFLVLRRAIDADGGSTDSAGEGGVKAGHAGGEGAARYELGVDFHDLQEERRVVVGGAEHIKEELVLGGVVDGVVVVDAA